MRPVGRAPGRIFRPDLVAMPSCASSFGAQRRARRSLVDRGSQSVPERPAPVRSAVGAMVRLSALDGVHHPNVTTTGRCEP